MGRAPCCDKANVKKGPWSPEEDAKLKSYIQDHGTGGNWIALPQKIGLKRCGKSCRLRWLNYLRPNIKHGGFSEEEDNIICTLFLNIGSRWSIIAAQLPGRTDNDIKNYWNTKLKKKLVGKQRKYSSRREMMVNKESTKVETNLVVSENMMNSNIYYPEVPVNVDASLYPSLDDHSSDQDSIMKFLGYVGGQGYDHQQLGINTLTNAMNFEYPFDYFSTYQDPVYESRVRSFSSSNSMNDDCLQVPKLYQGFNYETHENLGTNGTSSVDSSNWGDMNSIVYDPSMGVQDCVFQEPRCFGVQ